MERVERVEGIRCGERGYREGRDGCVRGVERSRKGVEKG